MATCLLVIEHLKVEAQTVKNKGQVPTYEALSEQTVRQVCSLMLRCGYRINIYRLTEPYMEIKKAQDRFWPAKGQVKLDNPLTAVMDNSGYTMYNFAFGQYGLSKWPIDGKAVEVKIEEPLKIRRIVLWYYSANALLRGIQLFNDKEECVLQTSCEFEKYSKHETIMEQGERIVGIQSRKFTDANSNHHDFQFVIGMEQ